MNEYKLAELKEYAKKEIETTKKNLSAGDENSALIINGVFDNIHTSIEESTANTTIDLLNDIVAGTNDLKIRSLLS